MSAALLVGLLVFMLVASAFEWLAVEVVALAVFAGVAIGEPQELWLLATDAGYGFTVRLEELHSRVRAGKALNRLPEQSHFGEQLGLQRRDLLRRDADAEHRQDQRRDQASPTIHGVLRRHPILAIGRT